MNYLERCHDPHQRCKELLFKRSLSLTDKAGHTDRIGPYGMLSPTPWRCGLRGQGFAGTRYFGQVYGMDRPGSPRTPGPILVVPPFKQRI
jgi:hypothetical protein